MTRIGSWLRQAWTGDRRPRDERAHLFVPSRDNFVLCAACGATMQVGDHDGSLGNNRGSFI